MLIQNIFALFRGNVLCLLKKIVSAKSFNYHPRIRIFNQAHIYLRNKGRVRLNKNVKIDPGALVYSNGGDIVLGENVGVGKNNIIASHRKILIGDGTILAPNVLIYDHDHEYDHESGVKVKNYKSESVLIGNNCWIGANTVILRGTVIGDNCLVGAGCVLKGTYPANSKIVQKRNTTVIGE